MPPLQEEKIIEMLHQILAERDQGRPSKWMKGALMLLISAAISITGTTTTILTYEPSDIAAIASSADFREYKDTMESKVAGLQSQVAKLIDEQEKSVGILEQLRKCQANMQDLKERMNYLEMYQNFKREFGGKNHAG